MMISPDGYVESELKGKTPDQVLRKIRGLQREMSYIKNINEVSVKTLALTKT